MVLEMMFGAHMVHNMSVHQIFRALARPIPQLCNLCVKLSSFPRSCKIAKVKLLFKKGSKTDPQNYRPMSLLPILSKIIERIIHDQMQEFLSKNKILYRFQSGF